ncbi:hypothetical protein SCLCIDRAFT_678754 [Scleroderma citrinum Foug A]|uniref:Uncharacterized protein n=1 Tax=Scleroderma citrinum Foug A TaxID=1036808 RepID=A0A0C3AGG6_9AGAM|nr:hypothetical protein SCLCIDRAFT_678754 [Scleroderma citrinum Foug A]
MPFMAMPTSECTERKGIITMAQDKGGGGEEQDALYYGGQTGSKYGLLLIPRHRPVHYGQLEYLLTCALEYHIISLHWVSCRGQDLSNPHQHCRTRGPQLSSLGSHPSRPLMNISIKWLIRSSYGLKHSSNSDTVAGTSRILLSVDVTSAFLRFPNNSASIADACVLH